MVVSGPTPGHVREEMPNPLPYPRQERNPEFEEMVDRLHAILTATLLPEPAPTAPQRLVPFPRVHVSEVTGLLDHLLTRPDGKGPVRSEEHTSELQSRLHLVCRLLLEKKKYCTQK